MARSRDLVVLSAILLVPLAAALALQAPREEAEATTPSATAVAVTPASALAIDPSPEPDPAPAPEVAPAPAPTPAPEAAPTPEAAPARDPSAIMLLHGDALILHSSPEYTWSSGKVEVKAGSGELIAWRAADRERLPAELQPLIGATVSVFAADGSACVAEVSAPRVSLEQEGDVYMDLYEEAAGDGGGDFNPYEPPRDRARVREHAESQLAENAGDRLLLADQRDLGGAACKGLWARRSDLPAPAVFGLRTLDDEEDAALVARALELVRPTPELAAMKSAYDARVVEYGDDAELPTWDAFVAANARATRWDEVGGPRRVVSFELYERPEECGDYFSEHVALLFEERGGALVRLDQPGWLGLEALMDLDRDGILEGIRREDLTTMVVAEGPNAAAFRDEFMIDYMGCRC